MKITIVEPYLTGSHAAWAKEYAGHSRHDVGILGLEGRHWKWRMHGGAVTLARMLIKAGRRPDLILATDMLDLTTFLALTREYTAGVKTVLYFHENQITYPWSERDLDPARERDVHYGFINFASALAADAVAFNSEYHRTSFLSGLGPFLHAFPDCNETDTIESIRNKSQVLSLGVDLKRFDGYRKERSHEQSPVILWNHRWEYDKNPDDFFRVLFMLMDEGLEFKVAVLGESFDARPPVFDEAVSRLGERILQFGFVEDFAAYAAWLWRADILPVTSIHDFFGVSVVQAIYCDCYPLLSGRLAYREHIPIEHQANHIYGDITDLVAMLRDRVENIHDTREQSTQHFVHHYDWETMAPIYDDFFESILF